MDGKNPPIASPSSSPYPPFHSSSSSIFKDISNFKTPKRPSRTQKFTSPTSQVFSAAKETPVHPFSSVSTTGLRRARPSPAPSSARHKTVVARRLKAFEIEQSQSSRKAQIKKEQSLKSLSKSLTVWLNFLFENPRLCGCDVVVDCDRNVGKGKREAGVFHEVEVGIDVARQNSKRQKGFSWQGGEGESMEGFSSSMYSLLRTSLKDVCSFDDLLQRMRGYLSLANCKEILNVMTRVAKNIDEGRLKMKSHCPIVTDVGMKEKATKILMSYNPIWLRTGLYIIFGGDSLLSDADAKAEDITLLKMIVEKQLFSHSELAKAYAYNKLVEGLYRPGYYENLGSIILKKFLLLILILDRAKCQSSLLTKLGIDGVDGGSPLLFMLQSRFKSSRQVVHDFLSSEIMLGEGNLLAHLGVIGYAVSYEQGPLVEYEFKVTDFFVDLRDGVRLCRAIQLLQHDLSILPKLVVPSDTPKKNMANCTMAIQLLQKAGVPVSDEDGMIITAEDVANGDKELTLSLIWNVFVHLQLPLLINRAILSEEIMKVHGTNVQEPSGSSNTTCLELLLKWIKAICEKYNLDNIDKFSALVDGKALWCLLDFYFRKEFICSCSFKDTYGLKEEKSIMSPVDYKDAVHNYMLSQKLATLSGNFPEVIQVSDLLEHNGAVSDQSAIVLLVFLASQLIVKKSVGKLNFHKLLGCDCRSPESKHLRTGRWSASSEVKVEKEDTDGLSNEDAAMRFNFKVVQAWWQDMAENNHKCFLKPPLTTLSSTSKSVADVGREKEENIKAWAAIKIQQCWMNFIKSKSINYQNLGATKIQSRFRGWLWRRRLQNQKLAITIIQSHFRRFRCWRAYEQYRITRISSIIIIQSNIRGWRARRSTQRNIHLISTIQSRWRGLWTRREFLLQREAAIKIQSMVRCLKCQHMFQCHKQASIELQRYARGHVTRQSLLAISLHQKIALKRVLHSTVKVQRWWKGVLLLQLQNKSAVAIQSHFRGWTTRQKFNQARHLTVIIQSYWRGYLARKESSRQILDLRLRMQKSAVDVEDCMRIINRLIYALKELQSIKSVSSILHICATLDMSTSYSQRCCEELVAAGAIVTLLNLVKSVSRSIPDQEVLKHALSTLRNVARFPYLNEALINSQGSISIIFLEFLRNKEEGYFIAYEVLKKMLSNHKGLEAFRKLPSLLKRLHKLVEELTRKANTERRKPRPGATRDYNAEKRLRAAVELLRLAY